MPPIAAIVVQSVRSNRVETVASGLLDDDSWVDPMPAPPHLSR